MSSALSTHVLVLNRNWVATRIVTAAEALADLFVGRVVAVDADYQMYDFGSWHELSEYAAMFEAEHHRFVQTMSSPVRVPSIVRLVKFDRVKRHAVRLSRRNVYLRDNYTCQYTGRKLPTSELNLDHVIPTSRGGRTCWENLVCCSIEINTIKRNRTPAEAGLKLIRQPRKPDASELMFKMMPMRHESWKRFVDEAYWNTQLHD